MEYGCEVISVQTIKFSKELRYSNDFIQKRICYIFKIRYQLVSFFTRIHAIGIKISNTSIFHIILQWNIRQQNLTLIHQRNLLHKQMFCPPPTITSMSNIISLNETLFSIAKLNNLWKHSLATPPSNHVACQWRWKKHRRRC